MSTISTIRSHTGAGVIRPLHPGEHPLLRDHLLRLDPASRNDRFNGGISDSFLELYAVRCFSHEAAVIAYLHDGVVRAAAELHPPEHSADSIPEIAFSVEDRLRRQGVGSALFEQLLTAARRRGYRRLRITTGGQNIAMKALAKKFGAHLTFASGEATGIVDLDRGGVTETEEAQGTGQRAGVAAFLPLAVPPWSLPLPALAIARDLVRATQSIWVHVFKLTAELFKLRPHFRAN
jgi:GNAT superfamily N-acetyltransferase